MHRRHLLASAAPLFIALTAGGAHAQASPPSAAAAASNQVSEVVVTAEKRGAENLLKVPVPVAVVNTDQLAEREQVRMQDYASQVPGFVVAPAAASQTTIAIRGITTGGQGGTPTVGVLIDDVPFGSSTEAYLPELDPGDLARIEVLRGPQGTLYGADSMGGLVRFITIQPSTAGFSGQVSAGTDSIHNGDGYGFNVRGSVNIPLGSTFAIRASAFRRQDPGYVFDVLANEKGSNGSKAEGGRVSALWRPTDDFSVTLSALSQSIVNRGSPEVVPSLGDLTINSVKGGNASNITVQNYSGVVNAEFDGFHFTSITGYNVASANGSADISFIFGGLIAHLFKVAPTAVLVAPYHNDKFSQEVRIARSIGKLDVQVGGFYTHENTTTGVNIVPLDPQTGAVLIPPNAFYNYDPRKTLTEYAGFGDLTYHFSDRFDIQLGARLSHVDQVFDSYLKFGLLNALRPGGSNPTLVPATQTSASPFTFLVTPRFQVTPDVMVYARAASGYRPGGTNAVAGVPPAYGPDKTYSYEVGTKGKFFDNRLSVDLSLYYVAWKQIQIQLRAPSEELYNGNGGSAKSEGIEFSATARPFQGTTISGWIDYDDAVLTTSFGNSPTFGQPGDRLPNSPKFSGDISLRQDFPLFNGLDGFVAVDASYTGDRIGIFGATATRQVYPAFTQTNLRAGVNYERWSASVYVNNVGDTRGQLDGGIGYVNPTAFVLIQPRTVGLAVTAKF